MVSRLRLSVRESKLALRKVEGQKPSGPETKKTQLKKPRTKRPEFGPGQPILLARAGGELEKILLPIRLTNNNGGRGGSYHASATFRKKCEERLRAWGLAAVHQVRFPFPVRVRVVRVLGANERKWDTSSVLRGNYKEIEDALVAIGWFINDSPEWIVETIPYQDDSRREFGPAIILEIWAAG